MPRLSQELESHLLGNYPSEHITLDEILNLVGERTFGFLLILIAFPSALPVPAPGYATPFGVVLMVLGIQMLLGRQQPWLPARWRQHPFRRERLQQILKMGLPHLQRLELLSRPRWLPICKTTLGRMVLGLAVGLMGLSMIIPMPGTNSLPALGIFTVGLGLIDDDGLIALLGAIGGLLITLLIWTLIIFVGVGLLEWIKAWF